MSNDVLQICKNYQAIVSDVFFDHSYFFPAPDGAPFNRRWLARQFQMLWVKARPAGNETSAVVGRHSLG
jgi:hypothetical protein